MESTNNNNPGNTDNGKRILCVGMCVLDIVHVCEEYPQEDTDKRCLAGYWQRGGNASNNCTVLRQLGAHCEFLGMLSDSPAFSFLLGDCQQRGIVIDNCPRTAQDPPFSSVIIVKKADSRTIVHSNSNFPILNNGHFSQLDLSVYNWIHFEARNPTETVQMMKKIAAFNEGNTEKIRISVELEKVQVSNMVLAQLADVVFLGKDLAQYLGWKDPCAAVFGFRKLLQSQAEGDMRKPSIICTWGAEGSGCLSPIDCFKHVPAAPPPEIVDSLGAGDTFCAATIYALLELKYKLENAVEFGNRCAGFKLGHTGYDAIQDFMSYH